jgi:hypothetical protein
MRLSRFSVAVLMLTASVSAFSLDPGLLTLKVVPSVGFPLFGSGDLYTIGGGVALQGDYIFPSFPLLFAGGSLEYDLSPTKAKTNLSLLAPGCIVGLHIPIIPQLFARLSAGGGYYLGMYEGLTASGPFFNGGVEIGFHLTPSLVVSAGGAYKYYLSLGASEPLYQGVSAFLGGSYTIGAEKQSSNLRLPEKRIDPIFPILRKYYESSSIGSVTLENGENGSIEDVKVSFFVNQYMEQPKVCGTVRELKHLQKVTVPLYALFNDKVLAVTEADKITGEITIAYTYQGREHKTTSTESLRLYDRNALTWDDSRKAAAFVTPKDPAVLLYSKNIASVTRERVASKALNENFRTAMGLFESLGVYGMTYASDSSTPYADFASNKIAVDYLQFPSQTLYYKGGDCDDLSILMSALLESLDIETAFITVPGHIYMAFNLGMKPAEAQATFQSTDDLIVRGATTWIPVEITEIRGGFVKAWQAGAREWRDGMSKNSAEFIPIRDAWKTYEPVGFAAEGHALDVPAVEDVARRYRTALDGFVTTEIGSRVKQLREQINNNPDDPRPVNRLGLLYARYGLYPEAETEFKRATAKSDYVPALLNLGNIAFMKEDFARASELCSRAERQDPKNTNVNLALARIAYQKGDFKSAQERFAILERESPELATRFSYLGAGTGGSERAASAEDRAAAVWEEE